MKRKKSCPCSKTKDGRAWNACTCISTRLFPQYKNIKLSTSSTQISTVGIFRPIVEVELELGIVGLIVFGSSSQKWVDIFNTSPANEVSRIL